MEIGLWSVVGSITKCQDWDLGAECVWEPSGGPVQGASDNPDMMSHRTFLKKTDLGPARFCQRGGPTKAALPLAGATCPHVR